MNAPHFSITTLFQQLNKVSNECSLRQVYASRCYSLCRSIASFNCPDRSIAFMVSGQIKSQIQANTSHKRRWSNTILKHKSQAQVKHKWPNTSIISQIYCIFVYTSKRQKDHVSTTMGTKILVPRTLKNIVIVG